MVALRRTHLGASLRRRSSSTSLALAKPKAVALEVENVAVMQQAIDERTGHHRIAASAGTQNVPLAGT